MDTSSSGQQVIMDLGDFVPEIYIVRFRINQRPYEVRYSEVRVDEFLAILSEATEAETLDQQIATRRRYVTDLFCGNLVTGDPEQLAVDLKTLPYVSLRAGMDIYTFYLHTQSRIKKKSEAGDRLEQTRKGRFGFFARLRFW